jgi:hypothetical protein
MADSKRRALAALAVTLAVLQTGCSGKASGHDGTGGASSVGGSGGTAGTGGVAVEPAPPFNLEFEGPIDLVTDMACGEAGTVVAARIAGEATFGETTVTSPADTGIALVFVDKDGVMQWAQGMAKTSGRIDFVRTAWAPDGTVVVAGSGAAGDIDLGGDPVSNGDNSTPFVAKYDPSGELLWNVALQTSGPGDPIVGLAVAANGDIAISGSFVGDLTLGAHSISSGSSPYPDAFIGLLDASGEPLWLMPLFSSSDYPNAPAVAFVGDTLFVTGYFDAPDTIGGVTLTPQVPMVSDAFLLRVAPDGTVQHAMAYGGPSPDFPFQIASAAGGVAIASDFSETLTVGYESFEAAAAGLSWYVASFDANSELLRAHVLSATSLQLSDSALDDDGTLLVGGVYTGTAKIGGQTLQLPAGAGTGFVALYPADGSPVWLDETGEKRPESVAMGDACEITVAAGDPSHALHVWRQPR